MSDDLVERTRNLGIGQGYSEEQRKTTSKDDDRGTGEQRKADFAYNHLIMADRPGPCKAIRTRINIITNYYRLNAPITIKYASFRLEFTAERKGVEEPVKKEKMAECFKNAYKEHRRLFPSKDAALVFNGTDTIYCPPAHRIDPGKHRFVYAEGPMRNGRRGRPTYGYMKIIPLGLSEMPTVKVDDEAARCAVMQFIDAILSQEHRFDLTGPAARFIQHGHSLFKIPRTDQEKRQDVKAIGNGEEVWLGLHSAVKCNAEELMLNADTSGSIFRRMNLNLINFFSEVIHGYTLDASRISTDNIMIAPTRLIDFGKVLKGMKLLLRYPWDTNGRAKKFDGFGNYSADQEQFKVEGRPTTVARYYLDKYEYRLRFPRLPCLKFYNKVQRSWSMIPMEFFYTLDEPARFKGKLSDRQLDVFVKAVCMNPKDKKARIQRFCVAGGDYLGDSATMKEWGISIDRNMVAVNDCPVLVNPEIEMGPKTISVNNETGLWKLTESVGDAERAIPPVERNQSKIVLGCVIKGKESEAKKEDHNGTEFLARTLTAYGIQVHPHLGKFFHEDLGHPRLVEGRIIQIMNQCKNLNAENPGINHIPLLVFIFDFRNPRHYATIKYLCDVKYGVANQCAMRRTYEKLCGNFVTNTSAQNLMLKILAKTGSVQYRLSGVVHKNVARMQDPKEPVLVIGIDVSHPGREERFEAIAKHEQQTGMNAQQHNRQRGQHEKLPTARPTGNTILKEINFFDCPRSVVSVVGTIDIKGSRYGVSSRVQRIGQEETVNMIEPFRERIIEFFENTEQLPKHVIVYRDGASDSQIKKIAYEEMESLERALESLDVESGQCTITYIMAAKRHHTRFFRENLDQVDRNDPYINCPPGTLVESSIVSRNKWDFYLQSHYGALGTALPTRYTVIRDDWKVSQSFIQTIVYAHCFGNARCPRPLSIPIPLHYAHLAAKRAKLLFDFFKKDPSDEYCRSNEDLVREKFEHDAITHHKNIKDMKGMHYA